MRADSSAIRSPSRSSSARRLSGGAVQESSAAATAGPIQAARAEDEVSGTGASEVFSTGIPHHNLLFLKGLYARKTTVRAAKRRKLALPAGDVRQARGEAVRRAFLVTWPSRANPPRKSCQAKSARPAKNLLLPPARVRTPLSRNRWHWLTDAWAAYQVLRLGAVFGHCIRFRWFDPVLGGETVDQPGQVGIIGDLGHEPLP